MILKTSAIVSETRKKRSVFNRILMINHGLSTEKCILFITVFREANSRPIPL